MTLEITCDNLEVFASSEIQYTQTLYCVNMFDFNSWMSVGNAEFLLIKIFVLLDKFCKIYKVVWNHVTSCCNINLTFISSRKNGLPKFVKSNIFIKTSPI